MQPGCPHTSALWCPGEIGRVWALAPESAFYRLSNSDKSVNMLRPPHIEQLGQDDLEDII